MLIGTSLVFLGVHWMDNLNQDMLKEYKIIEVNGNANYFTFNQDKMQYYRNTLQNHDFSYHSRASFTFSSDNIFDQSNRKTLLAEIEAAHQIGFDRIIFHICEPHNKRTIEFIEQANKIATEKNVKLVLENNSIRNFTSSEELLRAVDDTGVKLNIDLGHLKVATQSNIDKGLDFINDTKQHLIHCHVHSNTGEKDQHTKLSMDDKFGIAMLKDLKQKMPEDFWWICETHTREDVIETLATMKTILEV